MPAPPLVRETHIAAPPATVFAFLTDPEKILSWMGADATTEAHAGGLYLVKGVGGQPSRVARGAWREVVPVHRLALSFGWEGSEAVPPGSSLVEIDLIERDGGTLLRFTHSGLPDAAQVAAHDKGWAHFVGRLAMAAAGRNPGVDRGPEPREP
ncbi:MAG TPA: SRPBCC domain-containing protein [Roseiarcus sp.]|nr:SRPBCC domain-containing protein [Roseiarcus sp.]